MYRVPSPQPPMRGNSPQVPNLGFPGMNQPPINTSMFNSPQQFAPQQSQQKPPYPPQTIPYQQNPKVMPPTSARPPFPYQYSPQQSPSQTVPYEQYAKEVEEKNKLRERCEKLKTKLKTKTEQITYVEDLERVKQLEQQLSEANDRIQILQTQIYQKNKLLEDQEQRIRTESELIGLRRENELWDNKSNEMQQLKDQLFEFQNAYKTSQTLMQQNETLMKENYLQRQNAQEYESKIILIANELERVNIALQRKIDECERLKKQLEIKQPDSNYVHKDQVEQLAQLLRQNTDLLDHVQKDNNLLREQINQNKVMIESQQTENSRLMTQIQQLQNTLKLRNEEVEQLHLRQQRLDFNSGKQLQNENEILQNKILLLENQNQELYEQIKNRTPDRNPQYDLLMMEKDRLENQLRQKYDEVDQLRRRIQDSQKKTSLQQDSELELWKQKYQRLEIEKKDEIEGLKVMLRNRLDEIEIWKQRCYKLEGHRINNEDSIQMQERVEILNQEISRLNGTISELRNKVDFYKTKSSEQDWLNQKLFEQQTEIDRLKLTIQNKGKDSLFLTNGYNLGDQLGLTFGK